MDTKKIEQLLLISGLLASELNKYLFCIKPDVRFEFKQIIVNCINANNRLLNQYKKDISEDFRDDLSETFGQLLENLKNNTVEKQIELLCLIKEWQEGNVQIID